MNIIAGFFSESYRLVEPTVKNIYEFVGGTFLNTIQTNLEAITPGFIKDKIPSLPSCEAPQKNSFLKVYCRAQANPVITGAVTVASIAAIALLMRCRKKTTDQDRLRKMV